MKYYITCCKIVIVIAELQFSQMATALSRQTWQGVAWLSNGPEAKKKTTWSGNKTQVHNNNNNHQRDMPCMLTSQGLSMLTYHWRNGKRIQRAAEWSSWMEVLVSCKEKLLIMNLRLLRVLGILESWRKLIDKKTKDLYAQKKKKKKKSKKNMRRRWGLKLLPLLNLEAPQFQEAN